MQNRVKEHRKRLGMTCAAVAEATGLSTMHVNRIERGLRGLSPTSIRKLCTAFGITESELFCEPDSAGSEPGRRDNIHALDTTERMLLRFWRLLPDEQKDFIFIRMTQWATDNAPRVDDRAVVAASR